MKSTRTGARLAGAAQVALFLSACSTAPPPPPAGASCLVKQNYCLNRCSKGNNELSTAIALLLSKPTTEAQKQRASEMVANSKAKDQQELQDCRDGCDTKADRCRLTQ